MAYLLKFTGVLLPPLQQQMNDIERVSARTLPRRFEQVSLQHVLSDFSLKRTSAHEAPLFCWQDHTRFHLWNAIIRACPGSSKNGIMHPLSFSFQAIQFSQVSISKSLLVKKFSPWQVLK